MQQLTTAAHMHAFFAAIDAERGAEDEAIEEDWQVTKDRMQSERYVELDPLGLDT